MYKMRARGAISFDGPLHGSGRIYYGFHLAVYN